jgi:hypothetical protein
MSKFRKRHVLAAALLAVPAFVQAGPERETNNPIASAQPIEALAIDAAIGSVGARDKDLDYFTFEGKEGDLVTLDIDGGSDTSRMNAVDDSTPVDVDTTIALFEAGPTYKVLIRNDDAPSLDPGSLSRLDSRIDKFRLPKSGQYIVGVGSFPRQFVTGGGVSPIEFGLNTVGLPRTRVNGDYQLLITGVTVAVQQISIDIKPGNDELAPLNPKSKGRIPVALLGSSAFSVEDVDTTKLTFGDNGDEASLAKCGAPSDVNGDAFPDMLCHFDTQVAAFAALDEEAILRGKLKNGQKFEGRGWLKIVPVKAQQ